MVDRLEQLTVRAQASIRQAMQMIDRGACEIVLVIDESGKLIGTVTDGDIRRALLRGSSLDDSIDGVMNHRFTSVHEKSTRSEVLDLMRARTIEQIPIVDGQGRLTGLHLLREMLGRELKPNWAVIMAGGRGERLRPLTDSIPKPMICVAGRPILERIVLHLVGYGIQRIFLSVHYKREVIERHFGDGTGFGCRIDYLRENAPLGTGGALGLLPEHPSDSILVLNGDLLTQCNIDQLLRQHRNDSNKLTLGIHEHGYSIPFGVVDLDGTRVLGIREKPSVSWLVNAGIYVVSPDLLYRIPCGVEYPLPALIEDCLEKHERVGGCIIDSDWIDVGLPMELRRARGESITG